METLLAQIMSDLKIIKNSDNYRSPIFNPVEYAEHAFNKCLDLQQKLQDPIKINPFEYFNGKTARTHSRASNGILTPRVSGYLWKIKTSENFLALIPLGLDYIHNNYTINEFIIIDDNGEKVLYHAIGDWYLKLCTE